MENFTQNKRIAMFSIHSDPLAPLGKQESGGQNVYVRSLMRELDKKGWIIDVFTRWSEKHQKTIVSIGKRLRVIRIKGGPIKYIPKYQLFDLLPELYQNFLEFIQYQNPYELFHGHYWDGGWMALKAHQQFLKPLIENFHSLGQVRFKTKKRFLKNVDEEELSQRRISLEKEIINNASIIITLSEIEKNDLQNLYGASAEKIKLIPGGVNLREFKHIPKDKAREKLNLSQNDFILLYVGRLEWRKGIGTLISAVKLLKNEIPNVKAVIVGGCIYGKQKNMADFKEYQRLLKKAEEEGVKELISFKGRVDQTMLSFFYSAADVFVIPSYYEPFGLVALEANACQVPVVASQVGGLQTTIHNGQTGLLFQPRNPLDLKEKVLQIYKSKELSGSLVKNAYENVIKNYSWQNIANKVDEVYKLFINKI